MAKSGSFSFTNDTASTYKTLQLYDMAEVTNYGKTESGTKVKYLNTQASDSDAYEAFTVFSSPARTTPCSVEVTNPSVKRIAGWPANSKKAEAINYGVYLDAIFTVTDSADATYRVDIPVRCKLELTHENIALLSTSDIQELIGRTVSVFFNAAGTSRIPNFRGGVIDIASN